MALSAVLAESTLAERARNIAQGLGCHSLWARRAGAHLLLGIGEEEAFARLTPLGGSSVGLSFRSADFSIDADPGDEVPPSTWDPMILVDDLSDVVEHALVAEGALPAQAREGM